MKYQQAHGVGRVRASCGVRRVARLYRHGSAYTLVVMTTMIVVLIGITSVALARIERRREASAIDVATARAAAHAAVEYGFLLIRQESNWANIFARDQKWAPNTPFGKGQFSLTRTSYDNSDPLTPRVTLKAVGRCGNTVVQYEVVIVRGAWVEGGGWKQVVEP